MIDFHSLQHCQYCRIQEHALMHRLTQEQREELSSMSFHVSLPAGSAIFHQGDDPASALVLRKGRAKITMSSEHGRTALLYVALPGELLGLSSVISGTPRQVSAITLEPCELDMIRSQEFLSFLDRHSEQFRAALDELASQHSCILEAIRRLALAPSLVANLARYLLGMVCPQTAAQTEKVQLQLTQEEIAQQLGATRESITRALSKLRRNNIIEQRGRTLTIRNRSVLEHLAASRTPDTILKLA